MEQNKKEQKYGQKGRCLLMFIGFVFLFIVLLVFIYQKNFVLEF